MNNKITPNGNYKLATRDHDTVHTSGITPKINGQLVRTGKLNNDTNLEDYDEVTRQSIKNAIQLIEKEMADGERIAQIINMTVYVNASEDFEFHSRIADYASNYLVEEFGEEIIGTRAAVGVSSLPGNAPVEISLIAKISS